MLFKAILDGLNWTVTMRVEGGREVIISAQTKPMIFQAFARN